MRSMTSYAEVLRPLQHGSLRLCLRSVNHKALELSLRLPPALFALEAGIRARVRAVAQRGKLDLALEVQDEPDLEPRLNRALLRSVAKAWQEDAEWLNLPPLDAAAFFRLPSAWMPPSPDLAERLEADVMAGLDELLGRWDEGRNREAQRIQPFFREALTRMESLRDALATEAEAQAQELPGCRSLMEAYVRQPFSVPEVAYYLRNVWMVLGLPGVDAPASLGCFYLDLEDPGAGGTGFTWSLCCQRGILVRDQRSFFPA